MERGPVISEAARLWVTGRLDPDRYYEQVHRNALRRAAEWLRARLDGEVPQPPGVGTHGPR
ncbi:MAG TPA: hypothetical protein VG452_03635 [Egibacteraceae bacterium]|nr:hypothetical protein [Egibacteraceae bacterium]